MPRWVAAQQRALSIAAVVIGALALVVWTRPTGLVVLLIVIVVLLVVGAIRLIAEVGRRADTQAEIQSVEPPVEPVEVSAEAAKAPSDAVEQPVDAQYLIVRQESHLRVGLLELRELLGRVLQAADRHPPRAFATGAPPRLPPLHAWPSVIS